MFASHHPDKINNLNDFERGEHLLQNGILLAYILYFYIVRNRVGRVEFTRTKNRLSESGSALKVTL